MANDRNLEKGRATRFKAGEEQARIAARGGVASGRARRERRALSDALDALLSMPIAPGDVEQLEDALSIDGLESANLTAGDKISLVMLRKAIGGDIKAFELIRDSVGEKPVEALSVSADPGIEGAAAHIREMVSRWKAEGREGHE